VGLQRTAGQKSISLFFAMLMTVVSLLLGIACLNVSGLLLAGASSRGQEFAIRASLGAGRGRLLRQMLTESLLLAIGGTLLGLILNVLLTRAISRILCYCPYRLCCKSNRIGGCWRTLRQSPAGARCWWDYCRRGGPAVPAPAMR